MRRQQTRRGFTIIEVMLFLAISGLMIVGVMAGIGGSINRQRYQDATTSVVDFFQGQYNTVDNVYSNRPTDNVACDDTSGINDADSQFRGTSNCSIIGRYITTEDGRQFRSEPVYAQHDITDPALDNIEDEGDFINALDLARAGDVFDDDNQEFTVPWGTAIYTEPGDLTEDVLTIVLIKMPTSGLIRTYAVKQANVSIEQARVDSSSDTFLVCVNPDGLVSSPALGVKILPLAVNTSGVQPTIGGDCSA